jgi:hypothetical protein
MKIKQISVFLENKPGHLSSACKVLADSSINIVTLSLADTEQFGILRLIVQDWVQAKTLLEESGFVVNITDVIATQVSDQPGGLYDILSIIDRSQINIEYMYAFTAREADCALLVFRFDDPDKAIEWLQENNIGIVSQSDLFNRIVCSA